MRGGAGAGRHHRSGAVQIIGTLLEVVYWIRGHEYYFSTIAGVFWVEVCHWQVGASTSWIRDAKHSLHPCSMFGGAITAHYAHVAVNFLQREGGGGDHGGNERRVGLARGARRSDCRAVHMGRSRWRSRAWVCGQAQLAFWQL